MSCNDSCQKSKTADRHRFFAGRSSLYAAWGYLGVLVFAYGWTGLHLLTHRGEWPLPWDFHDEKVRLASYLLPALTMASLLPFVPLRSAASPHLFLGLLVGPAALLFSIEGRHDLFEGLNHVIAWACLFAALLMTGWRWIRYTSKDRAGNPIALGALVVFLLLLDAVWAAPAAPAALLASLSLWPNNSTKLIPSETQTGSRRVTPENARALLIAAAGTLFLTTIGVPVMRFLFKRGMGL